MKVTKLARVANCPIDELEAIAHYGLSNSRHARLAGHKLLPIHLRRMKPAICPECVAGKGYIEAHWELLAMTGCPLHKRTLLSSCEKCGKQLRWFRRGLRECSCGAQLMGVDLPLIPQEEAELLDVVRRCVLRLPAPTDTLSKLPIEDLSRMELHPLLTLIHVLGHHYRALRQTTENSYVGSYTRCAAEVLSDWPRRLFTLLTVLMQGNESRGFARGKQSSLYFSLFKSDAIPEREQVEFIKRAFVEFAANHWGHGAVDKKLLKRYGTDNAERYITIGSLAKRLNIHPKTAKSFVAGGTVSHRKVEMSGIKRIVIDSHELKINPLLSGKFLTARKAAADIGMPVALLRALRDSGDYEAKSYPGNTERRGFHEVEVQGFIEHIRNLACVTKNFGNNEECMTVRSALHELRHSVEAQVHFIQKILKSRIRLFGDGATAVTDLQIPVAEFHSVRESEMPPWYNETTTGRTVEKWLGCSSGCVQVLAKRGNLEEKMTPIGIRITKISVRNFSSEFVRLGLIASTNNTSARALMKSCQVHGVFMLIVSTPKCETAFVKNEDAERVVELRRADQNLTREERSRLADAIVKRDETELSSQLREGAQFVAPLYLESYLPSSSGTVSWKIASKVIDCGRECISVLIARGLLKQKQTSLGSRITKQSIVRFTRKYISMMELSRLEGATSRRLRKLCTANNIPVLSVSSRCAQHSFIRREDSGIVLRARALLRS